MVNQPYVKEYGKDGKVRNPITKENPYLHPFKSRSEFRAEKRNYRFKSNKKGISLSVIGTFKYKKVMQRVPLYQYPKDPFKGEVIGYKTVNHSISI